MSASLFGIVPAAGLGTRLGAERPKQYLAISGRSVLEHAVRALLADHRVELVFVVLAVDDRRFAGIDWGGFTGRVAPLYCGGATRRESVHHGLIAASDVINLQDWVLVHDAARPCLARADLGRLIDTLWDDAVGGLLAQPVADTLKRADADARVVGTASRTDLWHAQTPQMFRHGRLLAALDALREMSAAEQAQGTGELTALVTDEAAAIERLGGAPKLVLASAPNPKVTFAGDLALATALLKG